MRLWRYIIGGWLLALGVAPPVVAQLDQHAQTYGLG